MITRQLFQVHVDWTRKLKIRMPPPLPPLRLPVLLIRLLVRHRFPQILAQAQLVGECKQLISYFVCPIPHGPSAESKVNWTDGKYAPCFFKRGSILA